MKDENGCCVIDKKTPKSSTRSKGSKGVNKIGFGFIINISGIYILMHNFTYTKKWWIGYRIIEEPILQCSVYI